MSDLELYAFKHHGERHPWFMAPPWAIELREMLSRLIRMERQDMKALDDLTNAVSSENSVIDSAVTLLTGLSDQLKAAGADPAKLQGLQAAIEQRTASLAAAVAANTPAPTPSAPPIAPDVAVAEAQASVASLPTAAAT